VGDGRWGGTGSGACLAENRKKVYASAGAFRLSSRLSKTENQHIPPACSARCGCGAPGTCLLPVPVFALTDFSPCLPSVQARQRVLATGPLHLHYERPSAMTHDARSASPERPLDNRRRAVVIDTGLAAASAWGNLVKRRRTREPPRPTQPLINGGVRPSCNCSERIASREQECGCGRKSYYFDTRPPISTPPTILGVYATRHSGRLPGGEGDAQQRQQSKQVLLVLMFATVIVEEPLAKTT
jgi:hypothetical protein